MRMSSTNEVTILPNAVPITTATARSITFPLMANSRNSLIMAMASSCWMLGSWDVRKLGCSAQDARFDPIFTFQLPNFPTSQPGGREGEMIRQIAVIGTGTMGRGIAYLSAVAGYDTVIHDADSSALDAAKASIESTLKKGVEKGKVAEGAAREAL